MAMAEEIREYLELNPKSWYPNQQTCLPTGGLAGYCQLRLAVHI